MLLILKHIRALICTWLRVFKALRIYGLEHSAPILVHAVADRGLDFFRLRRCRMNKAGAINGAVTGRTRRPPTPTPDYT
jgi:hypothetical protein